MILRKLFIGLFPTLPVELTWDWRLYAAGLAVGGKPGGSILPRSKGRTA